MQNTTSAFQEAVLTQRVISLLQDISPAEIEQQLWDMFTRSLETDDADVELARDTAFFTRTVIKFFQDAKSITGM